MKAIPFNEKEMEVVEKRKIFGNVEINIYNYPVTTREAVVSSYVDKEPLWIFSGAESSFFCPSVIPDHVARGLVVEGVPLPRERFGGKDMFGVNWRFIDVAGGSMSEGMLFDNVNDWKKFIDFDKVNADVDSWDWAGSAEMNKEFLASGPKTMWFLNGCWFERLLSFMTFENAAMALLDEEQEDAMHELLHETTSLYMHIVDKCVEYFDIPGFCIHDDWGSQMAPFFSAAVGEDFFLPEMKRFCDHVHSYGKYIELHSCGKCQDRCNIFVEAGFDMWSPMSINDTNALCEKWGEKIAIGVCPNELEDPENATDEELRAAARSFAAKYAKPGHLCIFSSMGAHPAYGKTAFREELYRASRIGYCGQE